MQPPSPLINYNEPYYQKVILEIPSSNKNNSNVLMEDTLVLGPFRDSQNAELRFHARQYSVSKRQLRSATLYLVLMLKTLMYLLYYLLSFTMSHLLQRL